MRNISKKLMVMGKYAILFSVGGIVYYCIEMLWRGWSHWTMAVVGGVCFVMMGLINEYLSWETPLWQQMLIAACIVTAMELVAGLLLNVWLGLGIWDYSAMPLNFMGQVCLPYFGVWFVLSAVGIVLDDYLRYWFFGEEKPRYRII